MEDRLKTISGNIRAALMDHRSLPCVQEVSEGFFSHFPHECCQFTAYIVLIYLHRYEGIPLRSLALVANAYIGEASHAWAKCYEYHIDITGDQFGASPIWVSKQSPWPDSHPTEHRLDTEPMNPQSLRSIDTLCEHIFSQTGQN